jgi:hypothetical protein
MKVKNKKIKSAGTPTQASPIDEKEGNDTTSHCRATQRLD